MWLAVVVGMLISAAARRGDRTGADPAVRPVRPSPTGDHHARSVPRRSGRSPGSSGGSTRADFPSLFPAGNAITVGVATLTWYTVCVTITMLAVVGGLTLLLKKTKIGLAFRAVSSNLESAELSGIRVGPTLQFGWALAAAVGTLGASIYVANPIFQLEPSVMARVLIFSAAAAALGGLDSLGGAIIGGLIIGMVQSIMVQYVGFIPNELGLAAAVFVLMVVLLFKPSGLFGTKSVERV